MEIKKKANVRYLSKLNWWRSAIAIILILGIFFRFFNIDKKVYWYDEAITSLRISGRTRTEFIQEYFNSDIVRVKDILKYQKITPEKNWLDTVNSLKGNVHTPLYFVLTRFWVVLFGDSVAVTRSFSAVISLLVFPCLYWLCRELFELPLVPWLAMAIVAISPFHVLYAQEARMYSLMTATIVLSGASLLSALRVKTYLSWGIYAVSLVCGFYTHLFFAFIALGQGIYVLVIEGLRLTKNLRDYLLASLASLLIFLPWILMIFSNLESVEKVTSGARRKTAILFLAKAWIANLGQIFIDVGMGEYFAPLVLILAGYSIYFLYRHSSKSAVLFILTSIAVTAAFTILPDVIFGGKVSTRSRYFIPCYLGIEIAVAFLLASNLVSANFYRRKIWSVIMAVLISGGIVSCVMSSQAEGWWNKWHSSYNPQLAGIINQPASPLLVTNTNSLNAIDVLSISHLLEPKVKLKLTLGSNIGKIPDIFSDVFVYNPSRKLKDELEKNYQMNQVHDRVKLFRLEK